MARSGRAVAAAVLMGEERVTHCIEGTEPVHTIKKVKLSL
jgi:hypothetical protein